MSNQFMDDLYSYANYMKEREERGPYSKETQCAILKAIMYVIYADKKITKSEEDYFVGLAMKFQPNNPSIMQEAMDMNDEEMLSLLDKIKPDNLLDFFKKAASADGEISKIEEETIIGIIQSLPSVKKEMEHFFNKYKL